MSDKRSKLEESEIVERLRSLPGWALHGGALRRDYKFADFSHAFAFMTQSALAAESLNHHPDWSNVWNKVTVNLNTHDAGGITELDFALAEKMEKFAGKLA